VLFMERSTFTSTGHYSKTVFIMIRSLVRIGGTKTLSGLIPVQLYLITKTCCINDGLGLRLISK
ncbi:hypothetical protein BgiMline_015000, partial [Biomphalaria glabrata]